MNLLLYAQIGQEVINKYKILSDDNSAEIGSLRMIPRLVLVPTIDNFST